MAKEELEKGSGSWFIFDLYSPHGGKITVKESEPDKVEEHIADLIAGLATLSDGWSIVPPQGAQPKTTIPVRDEQGLPVVDGEQKPVFTELPPGVKLYTVQHLMHGKTKPNEKNPTGMDVVNVITIEAPYNTKYGVKCFHPTGLDNWKTWVQDAPQVPLPGFFHVLIRDPQGESKFPEVVEFRP